MAAPNTSLRCVGTAAASTYQLGRKYLRAALAHSPLAFYYVESYLEFLHWVVCYPRAHIYQMTDILGTNRK
jgi:hypothetical protein